MIPNRLLKCNTYWHDESKGGTMEGEKAFSLCAFMGPSGECGPVSSERTGMVKAVSGL